MGPKEAKTPFFGMEKKAEKATNISGRQNHGVGEWQGKKTIPREIALSREKSIKACSIISETGDIFFANLSLSVIDTAPADIQLRHDFRLNHAV